MNQTDARLRCHSECFERPSNISKLKMSVSTGLNCNQYISKAESSKVSKIEHVRT